MRTLPIGDERVDAQHRRRARRALPVRRPRDRPRAGVRRGRGHAGGGARQRRHAAAPLPPWQRAEILDAAAHLLAERTRSSPAPSPRRRPSRSRRRASRPQRAVGTFQFAAAEARTLAGEMVPLDASTPGEGKLGFTLRVPIGVVGAISPFNFPLNLVAHKLAPAIAAGCPVVLKPASPDAAVGASRLAELLIDECGLPAGLAQRRHRRRRHGRQRARRPPRHRPDHVHRLARGRLGHPRPRRRARRSASSSATTRR